MSGQEDASKSQRTMAELPDLVIEGELGRGGMGVVYKGYQPMLDRTVAVKLLNVDLSNHAVLDRFRREARILANLSHPHIVACYSAGTNDEGKMFLVMEFIDGPPLNEYIGRNGPLRPSAALGVVVQVAQALEYANQQGIIHRDIKSENILLKATSQSTTQLDALFPFQPKVVDLGLARIQADVTSQPTQLTQAGTVMGTPTSMAPEMFNDPDNVDFRADIYGLGCVLFHMLTGKRPYEGRTLSQIVHAKFNEPAPSPQVVAPEIPADVAELTQRLMARERENRPASYAEVIAECRRLLEGRPSAVGMPKVRRSRAPVVVIGLVAGLTLAGLGAWALMPGKPQPQSEVVTPSIEVAESVPVATAVPTPAQTPAPTPEPTPTPSPTPKPIRWDDDGKPLFAESFVDRLVGWNPPTKGSSWGAGEDDGSVVGTGTGRLSHPVPETPWFIQGNVRFVSAREVSAGVLMGDGTSAKVLVQDLSGTYLGRVQHSVAGADGTVTEVLQASEPTTLPKDEQVAWRIISAPGALTFEINGSPVGTIGLQPGQQPEAAYIGVVGGAAIFVDLSLHGALEAE
ncbi:protein kinase [bacterium]|nr:protein kinase [bacterium]